MIHKLLTGLLLIGLAFSLTAQKPKWLKKKNREKLYNKTEYLTGYVYDNLRTGEGIANAVERVKVMAKSDIAQTLISEIQSDHSLVTVEDGDDYNQRFEANVVSEAKAEIYNITAEGYYHKRDKMVYGFAYAKRDDVEKYYETNIDKFMQEILSIINVADELIDQKEFDDATQELEKTRSLFTKIDFASDFIVLIKSQPIDNAILEKIRSLKYKVENKLEEIDELRTKVLYELTYNYETYQILPSDLNGTYNWKKAKKACEEVEAFGFDDWMLPPKNVLNEMYLHKREIQKFNNTGAYWSGEEKGENAWGKEFSANGVSGFGNKAGFARVRCVRLMK